MSNSTNNTVTSGGTGQQQADASALKDSLKDVISSTLASAACVYTGQPFDTVKVRLQTAAAGEFQGTFPKMAWQCLSTTWNQGAAIATQAGKNATLGSISALWAGSVPAYAGAVLENAAAFGINGALTRMDLFGHGAQAAAGIAQDKPAEVPVHESFVTGSITGFLTALVLCPCDVIKCRSQIALGKNMPHDTMSVLRHTLATTGTRGLFVGMGAQILRDVPFYAVFFGVYQNVCSFIRANTTWTESVVYATAGGLAGQLAWVSSIVPDAVKSTIQTATHPKPFMVTLREIVATRGIYRGVFAGVEVAVIRAYPANAALFVGYEYARKACDTVF